MVSENGFLEAMLFLFLTMLLTMIVVFFVNAVYIFILKITTPQKFQSILSSLQIIFAVVIFGGYQIMPRLISFGSEDGINFSEKKFITTIHE